MQAFLAATALRLAIRFHCRQRAAGRLNWRVPISETTACIVLYICCHCEQHGQIAVIAGEAKWGHDSDVFINIITKHGALRLCTIKFN